MIFTSARIGLYEFNKYISDKNAHDLARICDENNISDNDKKTLQKFVSIYGERNNVLQELETLDEYVNPVS